MNEFERKKCDQIDLVLLCTLLELIKLNLAWIVETVKNLYTEHDTSITFGLS